MNEIEAGRDVLRSLVEWMAPPCPPPSLPAARPVLVYSPPSLCHSSPLPPSISFSLSLCLLCSIFSPVHPPQFFVKLFSLALSLSLSLSHCLHVSPCVLYLSVYLTLLPATNECNYGPLSFSLRGSACIAITCGVPGPFSEWMDWNRSKCGCVACNMVCAVHVCYGL